MDKRCIVKNCTGSYCARGWCHTHYKKLSATKASTPGYRSWGAMKRRCTKPTASDYPYYGGRGIKVCDRWLSSFDNFIKDMGVPNSWETLDRIDNDGNYESNNCRWVSRKIQAQNRGLKSTNKSGYTGVSFHPSTQKWRATIFHNGKSISLGLYFNPKEASLAYTRAKAVYHNQKTN